MLRKNIAFTQDVSLIFSLTGDLHEYSKQSLNNVYKFLNKYHPSINFSVGDFPHLFHERDLQYFKYLDLVVPGNHEFYNNSCSLEEIRYAVPFVSVSSFENSEQIFPSYRLFESKGKKIAVIGLNIFSPLEEPAKRPQFSILPFNESLDKAAELTRELKDRADFFVYLSHCGLDNDVKLLEQIPLMTGITTSKMLILGGHNHIVNPIGNKVLNSRILHSGTDMQYLGLAKVSFDVNNDTKVSLLNIPLQNKKEVVLANSYPVHYIEKDLGLYFVNNDFFHVSPLGAVFTDKVRRDYQADVVIINSGGIRDVIDQDYLQKQAKDVTSRILPFNENYFISFEANQRQIIKIIKKELNILNSNVDSHAGKLGDKLFFQVSGLFYSFKKNRKGKYYLNKFAIHENKEKKGRRSPGKYKVVLPNFLWDIFELEKEIGKNKTLIHESVKFPLERFLTGNSLKTIKPSKNSYKRKILED